jgi:hypothetical protein
VADLGKFDWSKLDWFANCRNAVSFLAAMAAGFSLSPLTAEQFLLVFVIAFAASRLIVAVVEAAWSGVRKKRSAGG